MENWKIENTERERGVVGGAVGGVGTGVCGLYG